jgi:hypothetical protein
VGWVWAEWATVRKADGPSSGEEREQATRMVGLANVFLFLFSIFSFYFSVFFLSLLFKTNF